MSRRRKNQEEDTVAIEAPERTDETQPEPDPAPDVDDTGEPADEGLDEPEATLDDEEKVGRLSDPRRAVVSILEKRLERMLQPVDEDDVWHGVQVITRRDLGEAMLAPLPPASSQAASVRTPAFIYVDAVCPVCGIATEIPLEVEGLGGPNRLDNIVPACRSCNLRKGTKPAAYLETPLTATLQCAWCGISFERPGRYVREAERTGRTWFVCSMEHRNLEHGRRQRARTAA